MKVFELLIMMYNRFTAKKLERMETLKRDFLMIIINRRLRKLMLRFGSSHIARLNKKILIALTYATAISTNDQMAAITILEFFKSHQQILAFKYCVARYFKSIIFIQRRILRNHKRNHNVRLSIK